MPGFVLQIAPVPAEVVPGVTTTEKFIPGFDGDPDVRILQYVPQHHETGSAALVWIHGGGYVIGSADADEILVLEAGVVVERGTHAQLLARQARYAQMWNLQQVEAGQAP